MKLPDQANVIKVAAVITATPRWVVALLSSEGFTLPDTWKSWWIVFSVLSAAGMAIVEGVAFAYVFNAWKREATPRRANVMLILAIFSAVLFIILLSPSIAASVRGQALTVILANDWLLWVWSAVVAASTIAIVASVGYAQKQSPEAKPKVSEVVKVPETSESTAEVGETKRRYSTLTPEEVLQVAGSEPATIAGLFGISITAAKNWKKQAAEVLQVTQ
jgi:MFS family permease